MDLMHWICYLAEGWHWFCLNYSSDLFLPISMYDLWRVGVSSVPLNFSLVGFACCTTEWNMRNKKIWRLYMFVCALMCFCSRIKNGTRLVVIYSYWFLCRLEKLGALEWNKIVNDHQGWRLFTCIWLHAGVVHLLANMLSLIFIGIRLEQQFGFGMTLFSFMLYYFQSLENLVRLGKWIFNHYVTETRALHFILDWFMSMFLDDSATCNDIFLRWSCVAGIQESCWLLHVCLKNQCHFKVLQTSFTTAFQDQ